LGSIIAIVFQGASIASTLEAMNYGFELETGLEIVDTLLNRGGIQSMMWTFSLAFCALSLGGVLDEMGYMAALVEKITKSIKQPATLFAASIISSWIAVAAMGEQYLSIILNGRLYKDAFKKEGLAPEMLSRALEEGGTLGSALIPWTTCATFAAPILGVATKDYAPWAFFNWLNPLLSIAMTYLGIFVIRLKDTDNDK
jgi:NhaC family Na+:H+ antiporter